MATTAILPLVPTKTRSRTRWFEPNGAVCERSDGGFDVFVGAVLIGRYTRSEVGRRNALLVLLSEGPEIHLEQLAHAFRISSEMLRQIRKRAAEEGLAALVMERRRGAPSKVTPALRRRLHEMFERKLSIDQVHAKVAGRVSRSTVARERAAWAKEPPKVETPAAVPADDTKQLSLSFKVSKRVCSPEQVRVTPSRSETALAKTADSATTEATAVLTGSSHVQHVGTWLMLGMLQTFGMYARAEKHLGPEVDLTRDQLRLALDATAMALSLGQGCVEGVRRLATPSAPVLFRSTAAVSANATRAWLHTYADEAAPFFHLGMAGLHIHDGSVATRRAVFYVDNHMRPYTGKHTLRKGWRMQSKRAVPGTSDYYVHDEDGRPVMRIDVPSHGSLPQQLRPIGSVLKAALDKQTRLLLVFDRGGAFAAEMAALRDAKFEFVTYERKPYPTVPASQFDKAIRVGKERLMWTERRKNLGRSRGRVRRISLRMPDGVQINVLAVSAAPAPFVIRSLLARWARQENQFKHEVERWGINQLDGRKVEPYPADEIIPNPARGRLKRAMKAARSEEAEALRKLTHLAGDDPKRAPLQQTAREAFLRQQQLAAMMPAVPEKAPVRDTELALTLRRHPGRYKLVVDTVRIALANMEAECAALLAPHLRKPREAKKTLGNLLAAPGNVCVAKRSISVTLAPAATASERKAFLELFDDINARRLTLPGDPDRRRLVFRLQVQ
jgi:transposase